MEGAVLFADYRRTARAVRAPTPTLKCGVRRAPDRPAHEKRSAVIIAPDEYESWLSFRSTDEARSFLNLFPADLMHAEAYPLPPRKPAATPKTRDRPLD